MTEAVASETRSLFHSPLGLFGFQAEDVAQIYWAWSQSNEPVRLELADTGLGKTVMSLATLALAFEDDLIDHAIVVVEANKVKDWAEVDTPRFTDLTAKAYSGPIAKRRKMLTDMPQVMVMTWATGRNDICTFKPKGRGIAEDGMLIEALRGKRVAIVFDEFSQVRTRSTKTYIAWEHLIKALRKGPEPRLLGLTATPMVSSPEDFFNEMRLMAPWRACTVADFYATYVSSWDVFGDPQGWKNLTPADSEPGVLPLNQMFAPIVLRRRKTDPEIIDQFPSKMENPPTHVDLTEAHQSLYDQVATIFDDENLDEMTQRQGFGLLRLLANHPQALLYSKGEYAKDIVASVGPAALTAMGSAKVEAMMEWQANMPGQQTVIFTFYGQSVLPLLHQRLEAEGYKVSINHGAMSQKQRQDSQDAFKAGDTQIFLSSDAGARGLNLGIGTGLLHYECPLTYEIYEQRSNRIHRIDSKHPSVTIDMLVASGTLEEGVNALMLKRNVLSEKVHEANYDDWAGDPSEGFLRASDRIALMRRSRRAR